MGKPIVISDVIERYRDTVFRLAFTYLRNQADADDVTQDVFVKLIRSSHDFESDKHLRRWLIRMTINECKSLFRKPWRRIDDIEDYANTIAMPTPEHTDLFVRVMSLPERGIRPRHDVARLERHAAGVQLGRHREPQPV